MTKKAGKDIPPSAAGRSAAPGEDRNGRGPGAVSLGRSRFFEPLAEYYAYTPSAIIIRSAEAELLSAQPLKPPVLDLCCGDGFFASLVRPSGFAAGCDASQPALEQAARRNIYENLKCADISRGVPFPDASFQTVVSNSSLEHIQDIDAALREISRVLKPGGRLYATLASDHAYEWWPCGPAALKNYLNFQPVYNYFSLPEWKRRLGESGLRVVDHQYYLSKTATRILAWLDYHSSRVALTSDRTLARPVIRGMRKIPPRAWSAFWKKLFSGIRIPASPRGGGILIAAEREGNQ